MNKKLFVLKSITGCCFRAMEEIFRSWNTRLETKYAYYYKNMSIKKNVILYEAFFGRGMLCNPYAIFLELLERPQFSTYKHIWVLDDINENQNLINRYKGDNRIRFIKRNSTEYLKYLASAKYLINNVTFPDYFIKKKGQVYINTWHGIPLKTLGFDMPNGRTENGNTLRNLLQTDYIISANSFLTDIYRKSEKLENIYQGTIIEEGYPRLDLLFRFKRQDILKKLHSYGVMIEKDKKIILYAPTWRGTTYAKASTDVKCYFEFKETLEKLIDTSQYQILIKVHQRVYELAKDKLKEKYYVPSSIDANEILAVTDILVSDFSSIYFDFLATNRPILFYMPDIESYNVDRGLYRTPDCLPGPCSASINDIGDWINNITNVTKQYEEKYHLEKEWSNTNYSGNISSKIIDIVFNHKKKKYKTYSEKSEKKCIFINRGGMLVNGISTSFLSLLDNIDYDRFDVSVMITSTAKEQELELIQKINPNVRVFCRCGSNSITFFERIQSIYYMRFGYKNAFHPMYLRDVQRCYGNVNFDYVIDFEGLNTYYALLCLQFRNAKRYIWQHSDMLAEKELRFSWLENIFKLYKYFDKVVSCSYDVMLVNRNKLSDYCEYNKFAYTRNFIDIRRINDLVGKSVIKNYAGKSYIVVNEKKQNGFIHSEMVPYIVAQNEEERVYRFVAMGRFSPEKNYENLISAFDKLYKERNDIYLYILGDGPLKSDIDVMISNLKLSDHVFTPGNVSNPFAILENCDCFILPSLHEGQPMVINEARILKMPIIVSNFSSVKGILLNAGQLVIGTSVDEIYIGLKAFIMGNVPAQYEFNAVKYNLEAYKELLDVLNNN